ncbi:MAG: hypothetical protein HN341_07930 [Verrucomicrobia bacterium]|jgi:hypothetical protein|nr:hypothetical protein [Verrucomicrobiota bacterium]
MSDLAIWTLGLGVVLLSLHGCCAFAPEKARAVALAFPRHKWAGRILSTIALLWAAWLLYEMPMGRFDNLKPWLYVITPVTIGMSFVYMEELLAPRALGGLMLLYPGPVLLLARLHESRLSLVMTVVAYILVIKGIALLLSPYLFRKAAMRIVASNGMCRVMGSVGVAVDLLLVILALTVY